MIGIRLAIIGTIAAGLIAGLMYYKYQYEHSIAELSEVQTARDSAIHQLNTLAEGYAEQVQKVNDYQERLSIISKANSKISSQLEAYRAKVNQMPLPDAEKESNTKTESILMELRQ